jgi:hypothetical protein
LTIPRVRHPPAPRRRMAPHCSAPGNAEFNSMTFASP